MSQDVRPHNLQSHKLDTGVILTTSGLFGRADAPPRPGIGPLTKVGGLSLFMRALLTLQRANIGQVIILSGDELGAVRRSVKEDPRLTVNLRWLPVREFPPDDPRTWQALGSEIEGACLVLGSRAVFGRGVVERLREVLAGGQAALVVREAPAVMVGEPDRAAFTNPLVEHRANHLVALHDWRNSVGDSPLPPSDQYLAADMLVVPPGLLATAGGLDDPRQHEAGERSLPLRTTSAGTRGQGRGFGRETTDMPSGRLLRAVTATGNPLRVLLEQAATQGLVRVVAAAPGSPAWYQDVQDWSDHRAAEGTLLRSLKGEFEGLVDRHFNRKISAVLSRGFLRLGVSANAVTMVSIAFGLIAAAFFAFGGYAAGLVGALLFQLSAIVDCCDGEIARLTFTESKFGEMLDIGGDNVVHAAIFAGIAWASYVQQPPGSWKWVPLALGASGIVASGMSLLLVQRAKRLRALNRWNHPKDEARSAFVLHNVASRDFSIILLILAVIGHLDWFLWMLAVGTNVFWVIMLWMTRPSLQTRV